MPSPRPSRTLAAVVSVASVLLATLGCSHRSTPTPAAHTWSTQINVLRSPINGLVYPPFLRSEPTTLPEIAAALDLRSLVIDDPQISPAPPRVDALRTEALNVSPLHGRAWLARLSRAGAEGAYGPADLQAVRAMWQPAGYYSDPADHAPTIRSRLADTSAALTLLHQPDHRTTPGVAAASNRRQGRDATTLRWLRTTCAGLNAADALVDCIQSLRALDTPPADGNSLATPVTPPPPTNTGSSTERLGAVTAAYWYVRWAQLTQHRTHLDRATWTAVLDANVATASFDDLHHLTVIALSAGLSPRELTGVRRRVESNTLPDGLVRNLSDYEGDVTSTFYALAVGGLLGQPATDIRLASALDHEPGSPTSTPDPADQIVRLAAQNLAAPKPNRTDVGAVDERCRSARSALGPLTAESSSRWLLVTHACTAAGTVPQSPPPITPWPTEDPEHLVAAAATELVLLSTRPADADTFRAAMGDLRPWVVHPQRLPNLRAYSVVAQAYLSGIDAPDPEVTGTVRITLDHARGCPGLPDLYRAEAAAGCDLATSYEATVLRALIDRSAA